VIIRKLSRITRKYRETGSTNEEMNRLLEGEILEEGTIVNAEYQTSGKGHQGNSWSSQKGKNLLFSILLKPEFLSLEKTFHLSRIISLSVIDVLDKQGIKAEIKWPNDILEESLRKKLQVKPFHAEGYENAQWVLQRSVGS